LPLAISKPTEIDQPASRSSAKMDRVLTVRVLGLFERQADCTVIAEEVKKIDG
jgi:hypothetical protein